MKYFNPALGLLEEVANVGAAWIIVKSNLSFLPFTPTKLQKVLQIVVFKIWVLKNTISCAIINRVRMLQSAFAK